jgi:uncharacterized membrane protein
MSSSEVSFSATVRKVPTKVNTISDVDGSGRWLAKGWEDFKATPFVSLLYGIAFVLISVAIVVGCAAIGLGSLILPLAGGFIIIAPILVVGLYDVSRRLEQGRPVSLGIIFGAFRRSIGQLSAMGVALVICFLVWIEVALFLFMIFFSQTPPSLEGFVTEVVFSLNGAFLIAIGSVVGAIFAAVVFSISAVSVPLIYDKPIDVMSAIGLSLLAVRQNWKVMFGWAALIAVISVASVILLPVLAVTMPVLAYATWHAYRDLIVYQGFYPEDVEDMDALSKASASSVE